MVKIPNILFCEIARNFIGFHMLAKSLEPKHTIKLIHEPGAEIDEVENKIKSIMYEINSPICKKVVPNICIITFVMPPSMPAIGIPHSVHISLKNG